MLTSVASHLRWFCLIIGTLKIILGKLTSLLFISAPLNSRNVPLLSLSFSSWWSVAELFPLACFCCGLKGLRHKKEWRNGREGRCEEGQTCRKEGEKTTQAKTNKKIIVRELEPQMRLNLVSEEQGLRWDPIHPKHTKE